MIVRGSLTTALIALLLLLVTTATPRTDDPVSSSVRFNREIIRIFDRKCLSCHGPDGIAMSLATYRDVRPWSRAIREEIIEQRMPPWSAARGFTRLQHELPLSPRELSTILTWLDGGLPKGDDSELPERHDHPELEPAPDHAIEIPAQQVPGNHEDVVRRVTVDAGLDRERWVRLVRIAPGTVPRLRAAFVFVESADAEPVLAGAWTPWQRTITPHAPGALRIPQGTRLRVELHYRGGDVPAEDKSALELFFAPSGDWRALTSLTTRPSAAVQGAGSRRTASISLPYDADVWSVLPAHQREGTTLEVTARQPDGRVAVLLWIPKARPEWPAPYVFHEPVRLPAGTVVTTIATGGGDDDARVTLTLHRTGS